MQRQKRNVAFLGALTQYTGVFPLRGVALVKVRDERPLK